MNLKECLLDCLRKTRKENIRVYENKIKKVIFPLKEVLKPSSRRQIDTEIEISESFELNEIVV